jgi:hypothetical protein
MSTDVSKLCADFLRHSYSFIKASHARELVAAFFGYKSHAAQLSEERYRLENIEEAEILIPAVLRLEERRHRLDGLPDELPTSRVIAEQLVEFLKKQRLFQGDVWLVDDIGNYMMEEYLVENIALDSELSSEIAATNAVFDEIEYESAEVTEAADEILICVRGLFSGQTIKERPYAGDEIDFTVKVELSRVAGKTAFLQPEIEAYGAVRDWCEEPTEVREAVFSARLKSKPMLPDKGSTKNGKTASPVELHKFPRWLERILKKEYPDAHLRKDYQSKRRSLEGLFDGIKLDHWGITEWHQVKHCFVTEPYGVDQDSVRQLKEKGRRLGFAVVYDPIAFHNPGGCERVLIFPTDLSPSTAYSPSVLEALSETGSHVENGKLKPKKMEVVKDTAEGKAAFERLVGSMGRTADDFFDRIVAVENIDNRFIFHCLKGLETRLRRALNRSIRWARETGSQHPVVEIVPITDDQLISAGDGLYASNDGFFIGAFEQKHVPTRYVQRVEELFLKKLDGQIVRSTKSEINEFSEQHIFIELKEPITAKAFRELYIELKPAFAKISDPGYPGTRLRKNSSYQSISDFMKENLRA